MGLHGMNNECFVIVKNLRAEFALVKESLWFIVNDFHVISFIPMCDDSVTLSTFVHFIEMAVILKDAVGPESAVGTHVDLG